MGLFWKVQVNVETTYVAGWIGHFIFLSALSPAPPPPSPTPPLLPRPHGRLFYGSFCCRHYWRLYLRGPKYCGRLKEKDKGLLLLLIGEGVRKKVVYVRPISFWAPHFLLRSAAAGFMAYRESVTESLFLLNPPFILTDNLPNWNVIYIMKTESEEWSSQGIFQFKQLERRSLKKIRASTGFEPVTSALPVRC